MEQIYTAQEVAEILKLGLVAVRRAIKKGDIEAIKISNEWRVRESALEAYLNKHIYKPGLDSDPEEEA